MTSSRSSTSPARAASPRWSSGLATDFALARSDVGFGSGYERPQDLPDEVLHAYLAPLAESDLRRRELERCVAQLEPGPLLAIEPQLKELDTPTLLVWGTGDPFFDLSRARWLRDTIPGVTEIVEIEGGKLFFPDERAAEPGPPPPAPLGRGQTAAYAQPGPVSSPRSRLEATSGGPIRPTAGGGGVRLP